MKDIKNFVKDIVHIRNDIIARLAYRQGVDLSSSNWTCFKPNELYQQDALDELASLTMHLLSTYKSLRLPELLQYCKESHKFNEPFYSVRKDDVLKLLGLDSCSDIDLLFSGNVVG
jgi:hypothetical protein